MGCALRIFFAVNCRLCFDVYSFFIPFPFSRGPFFRCSSSSCFLKGFKPLYVCFRVFVLAACLSRLRFIPSWAGSHFRGFNFCSHA